MITRFDLEELARERLRPDEKLLWCGSTVHGASFFERGCSLASLIMTGVFYIGLFDIAAYSMGSIRTSRAVDGIIAAAVCTLVTAAMFSLIVWCIARGGNYAVTDKRVMKLSDTGRMRDEYVFRAGRIAKYDVSQRDVGYISLHTDYRKKGGGYYRAFTIRGVDSPKEVYGMVCQCIDNADNEMILRGKIYDYEDRS